MNRITFLFLWLTLSCLGMGSETLEVVPGDSLEQILEKSVQVTPAPRQLLWQEGEFICFIHFGVNTFTGREWGSGKEDPGIFTPEKLDTDQWCAAMKAAGMTKAILTVKHHDGFCLWPTRYTTHSVASSPWRNSKGDVLGDLAKSCKKFGLQLGIYLSPADLYQIENPKGLYGNLSKYTKRTIPRPAPGRPFKDKRTFTYTCDDYNEYFMNQLFELLTEYGPVHEVWFDGAHPKRKGGQTYTYNQWYELIRTLAPDAVIFGKGPDVRWCGNEAGGTRAAEWNVIPIPTSPDQYHWPDMQDRDLGGLNKLKQLVGKSGVLHWYPAETNTSIRHQWFWRDEKQRVRGVQEMLDIWYRSVGGNTVFLLNIPPNSDGLFPERDCKVIEEVGAILKKTFAHNLAQGAVIQASAVKGAGFEAKNSLDGDTKSCWMPPDGTTQGELILTLKAPVTFNRIVLQEQIQDFGQRIISFAIDAEVEGAWNQIVSGQTVGYKRICRVTKLSASKVRVRVLDSRTCPTISNLGLFLEPVRLSVPVIRRNKGGEVRIFCNPEGPEIRYTLDGSSPDKNSQAYQGPFSFPEAGVVKARAYDPQEDGFSESSEAVFGLSKKSWKVVSVDSEQKPNERCEYAIDNNPDTFWHTQWTKGAPPFPHEMVIDLGATCQLNGFTYLPRQDGNNNGAIMDYAFYVSPSPNAWGAPAAKGRFSNILNNPIVQQVRFKAAVTGRYLRFQALSSANNQPWASAAEVGIILD